MNERPIRVAFPPVGGHHWLGGQNYVGNLVRTLNSRMAACIQPVLFVDPYYAPDMINALAADGVELVRDRFFAPARQYRRLLGAMLTGVDHGALRRYRAKSIDLVFENANYHGWRFPLPTLAWIPDFQHRHLPWMFSETAWWKRELGFRMLMIRGEHLLLSSNSARQDLHQFYPKSGPVHVVPFAVPPPALVSDEQIAETRREFGISKRWYFLPNQFWKHKNHATVIEALAIVRADCPDITVVCTGNPHDPRDPALFEQLIDRIEALELGEHFRILGMVPLPQVYALMQGSVALINPSRFEGWSTVVEEAKALSVRMILSDLDVHREQAGNAAVYFPRSDPEALARVMAEEWHRPPAPARAPDADASIDLFAERFALAVKQATHGA